MIHIGIDDTDTLDSPGTNQLARQLAAALPPRFALVVSLRHQLLFDPRVPFTSKNGCASLLVTADARCVGADLLPMLRQQIRSWYRPGSDPGLCLTEEVPAEIVEFGRRCQRELVRKDEALALAARHDVHLEAFGGTEDGIIGALAGVGLLASGEDGRVIHLAGWGWPDPFSGWHSPQELLRRGVQEIRDVGANTLVREGVIDIGKHLRPSYRDGRVVLFVEAAGEGAPAVAERRWRALKLP